MQSCSAVNRIIGILSNFCRKIDITQPTYFVNNEMGWKIFCVKREAGTHQWMMRSWKCDEQKVQFFHPEMGQVKAESREEKAEINPIGAGEPNVPALFSEAYFSVKKVSGLS